ncbi:UNVERIFIED_CONTAM: protein GIGANTEA [Sesamum angustifolium]|uniref:Protein GIGANTEA n=1 Tax=Sesamum angustifolium TaxID=2727405 RepID=A0AAW2LUS2_9LAMI
MATSNERWIDSLQFSSLFWPPPQDVEQRKAQIAAYVEFFGQFTSEQFPDDIAELIRNRYPSNDNRLFDDVLATFVLHHPEHGHAVLLPLFRALLMVHWNMIEVVLHLLLSFHWFAPTARRELLESSEKEADRSSSGTHASTSRSKDGEPSLPPAQLERKPLRPLSPWITDILLAAPLAKKCGGVMGKYAAGELKPPSTATSRGSGKHPQLMPSTPRWAVANGAGVILSVCDEEVARYETATLTAAAVPALLLPPPTTPMDEHLVAGLPALEPYARLFHR